MTAPDKTLVEYLRKSAKERAAILKQMADAKSSRNRTQGDEGSCYLSPDMKDLPEWKAADELERLLAENTDLRIEKLALTNDVAELEKSLNQIEAETARVRQETIESIAVHFDTFAAAEDAHVNYWRENSDAELTMRARVKRDNAKLIAAAIRALALPPQTTPIIDIEDVLHIAEVAFQASIYLTDFHPAGSMERNIGKSLWEIHARLDPPQEAK